MINGGDDDDDDDDNDDDNVSVSVVKNSCRFEYVNMSDFKNDDSPHLFVAPKSLSSNFFFACGSFKQLRDFKLKLRPEPLRRCATTVT